MEKILGLDLGTNSIGWALRDPSINGDNQIEKFGVLTFNKGVGKDKTGEFSYAAQRTSKRSVRRLYQARKYRLWATLGILIREGYCPLSIENLNKWRKYSKEEALKNENGGRVYPADDLAFESWVKLDFNGDGQPDYTSPYQLRKELVEQKLDLTKEVERFKLGRALYHIAQRRGFKSSRKGAEEAKEKEDSGELDLQYSEMKKNKVIQELHEKYPSANTIGALFAHMETDGVRIRENLAQHAIRENFKDEIKFIFGFQGIELDGPLYKSLVETGRSKNDGAIFYKRPLRSQKGLIGKCMQEPTKYRSPISHPAFEKFRALCFINNIKFRPKGVKEASFETLPLNLKKEVFNKLFFRKKAHFPFSEIAECIVKSGKKWEFNYKYKTTVSGCPVSARLKEIWGEDFWKVRIPKAPSEKSKKEYYDLEDIWHVLFSFEDQEYVVDFANEKLKLEERQTTEFVRAWNGTPVGYAMLSLNAINKINPFLEKGLIYTEAVLLAKIPDIIGRELWVKNEALFLSEISNLISENRQQKSILHAVNGLISKHKNLPDNERFGFKNNEYRLGESDFNDISKELEAQFGKKNWSDKTEVERKGIEKVVTECYQAYFRTSGFEVRYFNDEKYLIVKSDGISYYKSPSGFYRLPKLIDTLGDFLLGNFDVTESDLKKLYHPSDISIYPKAREDENGILKLGSPKTGSFKNPMAMRTLHEVRKLINYLIESNQIDSDTRVVVEVARELNDANKRWAIETWQKRREEENQEFEKAIKELKNQIPGVLADPSNAEDIDKMRIWYEQNLNEEEIIPALEENKREVKGLSWQSTTKSSYKQVLASKEQVDKYRLWMEQDCICIYTGKLIKLTDLFDNNVIDFEHTIPASISFDNSLANLTVCYHDYNRTVKKKRIPFDLPNYNRESGGYSAILPRLEKWIDRVARIKQQIDFWSGKSKKASTKEFKDSAIRQRHLWQMDLDYWRNKVDRFLMEEVTSGFKNSQKVDTQLISKYAFHYLKSYFDKVSVQKGVITAEFRKMYGLQVPDEKKDRAKHSHHAKDAAVLTLIPQSAKRDELLQTYFEHKERKQKFITEPYSGFKREFIWGIDDDILINNIPKNQTLSPAKRIVRKRGKVQFIDGTNQPMVAAGDSIRGQLHQETFFGAIRLGLKDENGTLLKDEQGNFIQSDETKYVVRVPLTFKKTSSDSGSFAKLDELEKVIVDQSLFQSIKDQVEQVYQGSFRDALEQGVYMLDKNGNRVNKIRRVRVKKAVSEPLKIKKQTYLSKHEHKQYYYAGNGENIAYGLYEDRSNDRRTYQIVNLFNAAKLKKVMGDGLNLESELTIKKNTYNLRTVLRPEQKVIFYKREIQELSDLPKHEISNRLYKIEGFEKDGRIRFKHHLNAETDQQLKEKEPMYGKGIYQGFSSLNEDFPWPKLKLSVGNLNMVIQGVDFEMEMDGKIRWL